MAGGAFWDHLRHKPGKEQHADGEATKEGEKREVARPPHAVSPIRIWLSLGGDFAALGTFGKLGWRDATAISSVEARNPA